MFGVAITKSFNTFNFAFLVGKLSVLINLNNCVGYLFIIIIILKKNFSFIHFRCVWQTR